MRTQLMPDAPLILHARVVGNQGGGPDKTVFNSARYAVPRYRMAAAYIHPDTDAGHADLERLQGLAADNACPLHAIPERGPLSLTTYHEALRLCRELGVAVWHAHDYKTDLLGLALRRQHPMKLVTTVHGWMPVTHRLKLYEAVDRRLLRFYDHVFAVSPPLVEAARQYGVTEHRLTYLPNGIETRGRSVPPSHDDACTSLGLSDDGDETKHLACIGRLSEEKRLDRAIRLIARLRNAGQATHLHLVGEGPQRSVLEDAVRRLQLADRVTFHGWQTDIAPYLAAVDAVLLTSETEGLPNALLEAMHAGVPVAATPVGGVPDLLDHGRCGVLLDPDNEDTWPDAISALLHNTAERDPFIATAQQQIANRFTFAARMGKVLETYDALLSEDSTARQAA